MEVPVDYLDCQWDLIKQIFFINQDGSDLKGKSVEFDTAINDIIKILEDLGAGQLIIDLVLEDLWTYLRQIVVPKFWQHFKNFNKEPHNADGLNNDEVIMPLSQLSVAVNELYENSIIVVPYIHRLELLAQKTSAQYDDYTGKGLMNNFKLHLKATLHSQMPFSFEKLIEKVYQDVFKIFYNTEIGSDEPDESIEENPLCNGCKFFADSCHCVSILKSFCMINRQLYEMDLLERLSGDAVSNLLFGSIINHVSNTCKDSYDQSRINELEKWLDKVVIGWLELVYCFGKGGLETANSSVQEAISSSFSQTYKNALYYSYTSMRISQLFNIVIEYPDSQPAIEDIKECLEKVDLKNVLVTSLKTAIQTRLLHPGVNTVDILHAYISTIKAMRVLDPKGILLEMVSGPIRQYLRGREDFVRYIMTNLTDDNCSELSEELMVPVPLVLDDSLVDDESMDNWETWTPDPIHAQNLKSKSQRTADIISMLVNIYGSKDVFIAEYRTILADRILSQFSYDTEKEVRYLEHLKVRFGDTLALLHKCEVMVKDVGDSKRINSAIISAESKFQFPVSAMILSAQFWPAFKEEKLLLPDDVLLELEKYTSAYQGLKGNRTLNWKHHLGQVQLEIEIGNRVLNLTVTPVQATVIHHFQYRNKWTLEELSSVTHVPKTALRRKIAFWQSQGIIEEVESDLFVLIEDTPETGVPFGLASKTSTCTDEERESVMASAQDQREEEMQVLWSYIVGMLTNLDSLPLDRIHTMLRMFVQGSVECTQQELQKFLDKKVRDHQLVLNNDLYRLPK